MEEKASESFALVTGASRGLGRSIAMELSARGIHTLLVGTKATVEQVCEEIKARYHTQSYAYMADLSRREEVLALAEKINREYPVSILVNNAGVGGTRAFADAPTDYIENIIDLNVRCTALLTHALLSNLMQQKRSYVLNIGSMAAHNPTGYKTVYPASKSFVLSFSLGLREELKGTPVSVSVCRPARWPPMRRLPPVLRNRAYGAGLPSRALTASRASACGRCCAANGSLSSTRWPIFCPK